MVSNALLLKSILQAWRAGSALTVLPEDSGLVPNSSQLSTTPVPGHRTPTSDLQRHWAHTKYILTLTHTHTRPRAKYSYV